MGWPWKLIFTPISTLLINVHANINISMFLHMQQRQFTCTCAGPLTTTWIVLNNHEWSIEQVYAQHLSRNLIGPHQSMSKLQLLFCGVVWKMGLGLLCCQQKVIVCSPSYARGVTGWLNDRRIKQRWRCGSLLQGDSWIITIWIINSPCHIIQLPVTLSI